MAFSCAFYSLRFSTNEGYNSGGMNLSCLLDMNKTGYCVFRRRYQVYSHKEAQRCFGASVCSKISSVCDPV